MRFTSNSWKCVFASAVLIGLSATLSVSAPRPASPAAPKHNLIASRDNRHSQSLRAEGNSGPQVTSTIPVSPEERDRVTRAYGDIPLNFEANRGQSDPKVDFISRGHGYELFLTSNDAVLVLRDSAKSQSNRLPNGLSQSNPSLREITPQTPCGQASAPNASVIDMKFLGANQKVHPSGRDELQGEVNYFIGNDHSKWRTGIPTFSGVRYREMYPGIDVTYHGNQRQLEYDIVVKPGADAGNVRLQFAGTDQIDLGEDGDLILHTDSAELRQRRPYVYQEIHGIRKIINTRYILHGGSEVSFEIEKYDHKAPLVIDPIFSYSTYLGGTGEDEVLGIAVDGTGSAFLTGDTTSTNFPTVTPIPGGGVFKTNSIGMAFVAKVNPAGTALVYSSYLGGSGSANTNVSFDDGFAIAVDTLGNAYVTGRTNALDFPTQNPIFPNFTKNNSGRPFTCHENAFVAKLNTTGNALVYSTYLGGSGDGPQGDEARAIAVDSLGNAYVAGFTNSGDFPTMNALQPNIGGTFVQKTTNSGATWNGSEGVASKLPKRTVFAMAIDPKVPNTLFVSLQDGGVWKTTDGGTTWVESDTGLNATVGDVNILGVDPVTDSTVYAAGGGKINSIIFARPFISINDLKSCGLAQGMFKSTDGGANWSAANSGLTNKAVSTLAIDPKTPSILYVGTSAAFPGSGVSLFKSTDGAATWNPSDTGLGNHPVQSIAINPVTTSILYASVSSGGTTSIYKSIDSGASWTPLANSPLANFLAIDPTNPSTIYAGGFVMSKSTDGGATWNLINSAPLGFRQITSINVDPVNSSIVYVGTLNGGLYKSLNGGAAWSLVNPNTKNLPEVMAVVVNPTTSTTVYAAYNRQSDGFVTKINAAGSALVYSTFLGGSDSEVIGGIAVDSSGEAFVTGYTTSTDYPTSSALQSTSGGGDCGFPCHDAFVTKINASGSALMYSTYLAANNEDFGFAIALDSLGDAYVTGVTNSPNFPVSNALQATLPVGTFGSAFVTKLNPSGSAMTFSTYFGGSILEEGTRIAVDANNNVTITGVTLSEDMPLVRPLQCFRGSFDIFVTKFDSTGSSLRYSTYLGGSDTDLGNALALDSLGNAYVGGSTVSLDFNTVNPLQATHGGGSFDAVIAKISLQGASGSDMVITKCSVPRVTANAGTNLTYNLYATNAGPLTATGVTVNDTLPVGLNLVSVSTTRGACLGTTSISCNLGTMNNDDTGVVTIVVSPTVSGSVTNTGTVTSTSSDSNSANNSSSATTAVTANPNPVPTITSLVPPSAIVGSGAFTLTVNGTNFINSSVVNFGGTNRATTFVSATQLTAAILAGDIGTVGSPAVTVINPGPGGGTSNSVAFNVLNPVPTITTLQPSSATAGGPGFTLTVNGSNFVSTSQVSFGGTNRTTTFVNSGQVTAAILAGDIASPGSPAVVVTNPGPGGGPSNSVAFNVTSTTPVPVLTSIVPNSATAGGPAFTLTLNGSNFISSSIAQWNGGNRTTTFVNSTQLTASITAADILTAGSASVTVFNPTIILLKPQGSAGQATTAPAGNTSNALTFTINAPNPVPTLTSLVPSSLAAGGAAFTLTLNGTNFISSSVAQWKGVARTTTFVSATQLTAAISASDIATPGTAAVTVFNPTPGGGTSNSLTFTITDFSVTSTTPPQTVPAGQPANFTIGTAPVGGSFAGPVTFMATGLPTGAVAGFNPASVSVGASTVMTVTTTSRTLAQTIRMPLNPREPLRPIWLMTFVTILALMAASTMIPARRAARRLISISALALLFISVGYLSGCAGGFPGTSVNNGTPAGTYTITVTGTSGSVQHSTTVTLTVQ